jgi:carbamoyltransferase
MQAQMNLKIKFREGFRPFAPSVLRERVAEYFEMECDSPYMLLVAPVRKERQIPATSEVDGFWGIDSSTFPIRHPGRDPHRLLGAHPDGDAVIEPETTTIC